MVTGQDIVNEAKKHLGKPYKWGAAGPDAFDCSGLVVYVYQKAAGMNLPHGTSSLINMGKKVSRKKLQPGDLVFPHSGHVGISLGGEQYIHAPQTGDVVKIRSINKFLTARRIL